MKMYFWRLPYGVCVVMAETIKQAIDLASSELDEDVLEYGSPVIYDNPTCVYYSE